MKIFLLAVFSLFGLFGSTLHAEESKLKNEHLSNNLYEEVSVSDLAHHPEHHHEMSVALSGWVRTIRQPENNNVPNRIVVVTVGEKEYPEITVIIPNTVPFLGEFQGRPVIVFGVFRDDRVLDGEELEFSILADWIMLDWVKLESFN